MSAKLESNELMRVTKIKVRVQTGEQGVKEGLVFLSECDPVAMEGEELEAFNRWTAESYKEREGQF